MRAIWTAILLTPAWVGAESHLGTPAAGTPTRASASVEFKIVIPTVLYLGIADGADSLGHATAATVASNGRSLIFSGGENVPRDLSSGLLIGAAGASHMIVQHIPCAYANTHRTSVPKSMSTALDASSSSLICTVAAP